MCKELSGTIVGMKDVTEQLMIGILCRGHCILQGMPGLAKTLLISQLASLMDLSFHRIQFTPDLMPGDITGGDVLEEDRTTGKRVFRFLQGPLFANLMLADEINRTPPKTQSALLEAMEERQLSVGGNDVSAARSVLRAGDAEPDRGRRHVSAARSAARPLLDEDQGAAIRAAPTNGKSAAGRRPITATTSST